MDEKDGKLVAFPKAEDSMNVAAADDGIEAGGCEGQPQGDGQDAAGQGALGGNGTDNSGVQKENGVPCPAEQQATEALTMAEARLAEAHGRLLAACAGTAAAAVGLTPRGAEAALRLGALEGCDGENGLPDEAAVAAALRRFKKSWPEFQTPPPAPPFATGTGTTPLVRDAVAERLGI